MSEPIPLLRASALPWPRGVVHGFTTRVGGQGQGPLSSLSLARSPGLPDAALEENWRLALGALDPRARLPDLVLMHQVHGRGVLVATEGTGPLAVVGEADAVVTGVPGLVLAVRVADCVPVLIAGAGHVAAVHAGWRGVAGGVVGAAVEVLLGLGERAEDLVAAIGPHISGARYEVGGEVVQGIAAAGVAAERFATADGDRWRVDLGAAVTEQLQQAGVQQVGAVGRCTSAPDLYSWRFDGPDTGRQAGLIMRRAC